MKELSPHARIYLVLVIIAGYLALGQLFVQAATPPHTKLLVLLLLASTCGPLRLRTPRFSSGSAAPPLAEESAVSVGLVFVFSSLIELPARYAAIVSMAAVMSQLQLGRRSRLKIRDYLLHLSAANLSLLMAYDAFHTLCQSTALPPLEALLVAALIHFLVSTWCRTAAESLESDRPVAATWWRDYMPSAPVYALMAVGGFLLGPRLRS
ncbi:MAG: hypothetical protein HY236_08730 [Acidobacteria bacterium]|nr:hypothetical protein [Acidobacteriota bacterium]